MTLDTAWELYDRLTVIEGVDMVIFDESEDHYRDSCALYDINLGGGTKIENEK